MLHKAKGGRWDYDVSSLTLTITNRAPSYIYKNTSTLSGKNIYTNMLVKIYCETMMALL